MPSSINFFDKHASICDYLNSLFERLAILGVKTHVVGSGRARKIFVGVTYKETNYITTVKEGVELAKHLNNPFVAANIDTYHMDMEIV